MTTLIAGLQNSVLVIESSSKSGGWKTFESLKGSHPQSIAFDLLNPSRAYCGTFGDGLWKTDNGGQTWDSIGKNEISTSNITSVSVSPLKEGKKDGFSKVYVGTEPSALYVSSNGGESWERMNDLNKLESSKSWSFPPRPWTHHVRWMEPDVNNLDYVFVAIEAGALVQSRDGGRTWIDRVKQSAGDGYFESFDYGESWNSQTKGLGHHYLVGLAVDSANPQNVIVSASLTAQQAHSRENANSLVYRRSMNDEKWNAVSKGFPESNGTIISILASNPNSAGEFYAINNRGIFSSTDSGVSWTSLDIPWSKEYLLQHPFSLAVRKE